MKIEDLTGVAAEAAEIAQASGLIYVSDTEPGIRREPQTKGHRKSQGKDKNDNSNGFRYLTPDRRVLRDAKALARIASLAIPPAYQDVWICVHPRGHLQATGRDARRRKQYRYHPDWRQVRDSAKFDRMIQFGEALPKLRRKLHRDLNLQGLPREKVLAVVVSLLDATGVRIGSREYARANDSFGLSTLRDRHVKFIRDGRALLSFRGKSGIQHDVVIDDQRLARLVRKCQELPGQQLFQYLDDQGQRHGIESGQVNAYLHEAMGAEFTAKDFRTWAGTVRAIALMACTPLPEKPSERAFNSQIVAVVKQVAEQLRNTPTVCRKSYINPVVFVAWRSGELHKIVHADAVTASERKMERVALAFLKRQARRRLPRVAHTIS